MAAKVLVALHSPSDVHLSHRFGSPDANAFRTFDWEIPNCGAIRDGVMPALNVARTAFT